MPNHITNIVSFNGDRIHVQSILEKIKNDEYGIGTVDFAKILSIPNGDRASNDSRVANWGTKWNAYGYEKDKSYSNSKELRFLTAWAAPHPILEKLSEMFPKVKITHEWADEDIGMNCGRHEYCGGERTEEYYPEKNKERIEFAARIMQADPSDWMLFLNASETDYVSYPDDEFDMVEIMEQKALFTNERMTDTDVPKGLYCYHLRHGDNGDFCSIEKNVAVNHGGTIIVAEPLDLGNQKYLMLDDDSSPNFIGESCTMEEFVGYAFEQSEEMSLTQ